MGLRKGQKELVEQYKGGYCAVPAIPGGGKTHCLSLWAAEMISQGLNRSGKILIVTYMNTAVNNFKQRIAAELQKRGIVGGKDYVVSTIHGLCLQIIKDKPDLIIANEEFEIIDEVNKYRLISDSVDEWKRKYEDRFKSFIEDSYLSSNQITQVYKNWHDKFCSIMLTAMGAFKTRGINSKDALEKCINLSQDSILKCAAEVYALYDRRLKVRGYLDFDDMLFNAKKMLMEDESLLGKYRKKYTYVCEDEAQDSNLIQSEILTMIAGENLLRVGDSNQAICGSFTSSDFKYFKEFCDHPKTVVYHITQSSRNSKEIIDLANYFVKYVRESHPVPPCRESLLPQFIEPVGEDDERKNPTTPEYGIKAGIFNSWEEEARGIVKEAWNMMKKFPDKTVAVLIPTSWKMREIIRILESWGIPFEQLDNTSREKNSTVRTLGRIIDFIALPESGEKLSEMINECFLTDRYDDVEISDTELETPKRDGQKEILSKFLKSYPVEKILYPLGGEMDAKEVPVELLHSKIWHDFTGKLDLIRDFLEFPSTIVEKLILYISEKMNFGREERAIAQKVAGDVRYLMNQEPNWRLSDLALELLNPKNMFNFFAGIVWELKGYQPKPGVVTAATYHKSKGLEWDIVFLGGLNFADFPVDLNDKFIGEYWFLKEDFKNPQAVLKAEIQRITGENKGGDPVMESKIETISEKARLLYVGITRAKEYLYLSGFHMNQGKKNEVLPSGYLIQLKSYIEEVNKKCFAI
ncbi:MAG: ATP-dependent helicase [Clostridia bacterium]|nr:ATP-dependent helicase [Clostridia bacterium]